MNQDFNLEKNPPFMPYVSFSEKLTHTNLVYLI